MTIYGPARCVICDEQFARNDETLELLSRELVHVHCGEADGALVQCVWCDEYETKHDAVESWTLDEETGSWYCYTPACQGGLKADVNIRDREAQAEIDALLDTLRAIKRAEERVPLLKYLRDQTEEALRG